MGCPGQVGCGAGVPLTPGPFSHAVLIAACPNDPIARCDLCLYISAAPATILSVKAVDQNALLCFLSTKIFFIT